MDSRISMDPHMDWLITRLRRDEINPNIVFVGKDQDKHLANTLKKKFSLKKMDRGYDIESINDDATTFATQLLSENLLRKGCHN